METLTQWIIHYQYAGIFVLLLLGIVGLPIPDETLLVFTGYFVHKGKLEIIPTLLAAYAGSLCGITLSYALGRYVGLPFLRRFGKYFRVTPDKMDRFHAWFERVEKFGLVIGYYLPGIRHFTAFLAGNSRLNFLTFSFYASLGGIIWCSIYLSLGYFLGKQWPRVYPHIHANLMIISSVTLVMIILLVLLRPKSTKNGSEP